MTDDLQNDLDAARAALQCVATYLGKDATDDSLEARIVRGVVRLTLNNITHQTEPTMTKGFWVIMSSSAGELDRDFAKNGEQAVVILARMARHAGELNDGDHFTIEEGETEEVEEQYDERI